MDRNEAIDIVRKNWPDGRHQLSEALETLVPELKESEDGKLSKKLHECVCMAINNDMLPYEERKYISEQVLPYLENLEKQKEQNPAWSEEDEMIRKALIHLISEQDGFLTSINGISVKDIIAWLENPGEQKPYDDELSLLERFKQAVYDCAWGRVTCKPEGETKEEYAERWANQFISIVRNWADDYIDYNIENRLIKSYEKGKTDAFKEQNLVEWSEEDEKILKLSLENLTELKNRFGEKYGKVGDCIDWLKTLKERIKGE